MANLISTRNERNAIVLAHDLDCALSTLVQLIGEADDNPQVSHYLSLVREALDDLNHRPFEQRFLNRIWKHCEQCATDVQARNK